MGSRYSYYQSSTGDSNVAGLGTTVSANHNPVSGTVIEVPLARRKEGRVKGWVQIVVPKLVCNFELLGNLLKIPKFRTYSRQLNHICGDGT